MIHHTLTDAERDLATLYALAALSDDETRAFEQHLADGCAACREEVDAHREVAGAIALTAPRTAPPPRLRAALLDAATSEAPGSMAVIRAHEGTWVPFSPGVSVKDLSTGGGSRVFLVKMEPGARAVPHDHPVIEHCFVVEGDLYVAGEHLGPGDHHIAGAGTHHPDLRTDRGCILLIAESVA